MKKQVIFLSEYQKDELRRLMNKEDCTKGEMMRAQAVLILNKDVSGQLVEELAGFDKKYVSQLRKKYIEQGIEALISKRKKRIRLLLTKKQREEIIEILQKQKPSNFGYESSFWTTLMLGDLIERKFDVRFKSRTSLYIIFKEARFSYHKPETKYKKKNEKQENEWIQNNHDRIQELLSEKNTVVLFGDEMMLSTQTTTQKIWLPKGEYPKIDIATKRDIRVIYGFLDIKTGKEISFKAEYANSETTCVILNKIGLLYPGMKIVIIWDNAPWHRSKLIKKFLTDTKHHFFLIQLPPYAPELNPQEHVWKAGRSAITHNTLIENIDFVADTLINYLNSHLFNYKFL